MWPIKLMPSVRLFACLMIAGIYLALAVGYVQRLRTAQTGAQSRHVVMVDSRSKGHPVLFDGLETERRVNTMQVVRRDYENVVMR